MSRSRGASRLGCLVGLLLLVTAGYFGVNIGEVYLRYYRYQDAMDQAAHFATQVPDAVTQKRLAAFADSIGLPPEAQHVTIRRTDRHLSIWSEYSEHVELPLFVREYHFAPAAEVSF